MTHPLTTGAPATGPGERGPGPRRGPPPGETSARQTPGHEDRAALSPAARRLEAGPPAGPDGLPPHPEMLAAAVVEDFHRDPTGARAAHLGALLQRAGQRLG